LEGKRRFHQTSVIADQQQLAELRSIRKVRALEPFRRRRGQEGVRVAGDPTEL
jgi:hypothetical protein